MRAQPDFDHRRLSPEKSPAPRHLRSEGITEPDCKGLVLVHVIPVLVVAVAVVNVIDVPVVLDGFVAVALGVNALVVLVNHFFGVAFTIMNVIDVALVLDGFVAVAREVFVIACRMPVCHQIAPVVINGLITV